MPETDEEAWLVLSATIDLNKFVFGVELSFHKESLLNWK